VSKLLDELDTLSKPSGGGRAGGWVVSLASVSLSVNLARNLKDTSLANVNLKDASLANEKGANAKVEDVNYFSIFDHNDYKYIYSIKRD
jgi:hypothetical protein